MQVNRLNQVKYHVTIYQTKYKNCFVICTTNLHNSYCLSQPSIKIRCEKINRSYSHDVIGCSLISLGKQINGAMICLLINCNCIACT